MVRRRRKMYSNFPGMHHALPEADYLGRYRLPVDAALVYKESARVLKEAGWKVNFRSRGEYEDARAREIGVGRGAGGEGGSARLLHPVGSEAHRMGYRWLEGTADQFRRAR